MPQIAFAGVGRMGLPMCAALVRAGYPVTATDRRREREAAAVARGARWRGTPAGAAAGAGVLITMLPGPRDVDEVMMGRSGALAALPAGATWIDMSSSIPAAARPLQERAVRRGVHVLEAPVGGGVGAARQGHLQLFVGGDAGVLAGVRPVLEALADPGRIVHVGGHGAGYTVKLLENLLWFGQAVAVAEALLLARRSGIDPRVMQRALGASAAASTFVRSDLDALFEGDYLASFGLDRICGELSAVTGLARHHRIPFELSSLVHRIYQRALARYGPADGELLAVALLEEEAGLELRPRTP